MNYLYTNPSLDLFRVVGDKADKLRALKRQEETFDN